MQYFSTLWPQDSSTPHIAFSRSNISLNFVFKAKQKPNRSRSCQEEVWFLRRLQSLVAICAVYFNCSANYMMRVCVLVCHPVNPPSHACAGSRFVQRLRYSKFGVVRTCHLKVQQSVGSIQFGTLFAIYTPNKISSFCMACAGKVVIPSRLQRQIIG